MTDTDYMKRALRLARRGQTSPNPMVGAVIVSGGKIVGEGFHTRAGEPHAEAIALRAAGEKARGAAMYVTLEPCCHTGRTPPCTQAIIRSGVRRVFAAMVDPDPNVAGGGVAELRSAGVEVVTRLCETEARELNAAYVKHRTTGTPLVTLKLAMSLDGRIATRSGDSKWITGERARAFVHRARAAADAVVVGAGTALADDPLLTARVGRAIRRPTRVVVAGTRPLPPDLRMLRETGETLVAVPESADPAVVEALRAAGAQIVTPSCSGARVSIASLMRELARLGHLSVLIEGGAELAASALAERVVDRILFFYAPRIIGGRESVPGVGGEGIESLGSAIQVDRVKIRRMGPDLAVEGHLVYPYTA